MSPQDWDWTESDGTLVLLATALDPISRITVC